jgi:hypothetical protein
MKSQFFLLVAIIFLGNIFLCGQTASIDELKKTVVQIGQLDFMKDVPVSYLDRSQMKKYIEQLFDSVYLSYGL